MTTEKVGDEALLHGPGGTAPVVLRWPAQQHTVAHLATRGIPRLLLVDREGDPPVCVDPLEGWVRLALGRRQPGDAARPGDAPPAADRRARLGDPHHPGQGAPAPIRGGGGSALAIRDGSYKRMLDRARREEATGRAPYSPS